MKPPPFEYLRPSSLAETLEVLDRNGKDAKLIAGGQSLVPSLNFRETSCKILVDLSSIESFSEIEVSANQIRIGAMVRQSELDQNEAIKQRFPEFAALLPKVGFPATRNRGTIGGSIAWADPCAEIPALALALDASVELSSHQRGTRNVALEDFLQGPFQTNCADNEALLSLTLPIRPQNTKRFLREVNCRSTGKAVAGIIATLSPSEEFSFTLFGWADRARKLTTSMEALQVPNGIESAIAKIESASNQELWVSDAHATASYRRHLFCKLLEEAVENFALY